MFSVVYTGDCNIVLSPMVAQDCFWRLLNCIAQVLSGMPGCSCRSQVPCIESKSLTVAEALRMKKHRLKNSLAKEKPFSCV